MDDCQFCCITKILIKTLEGGREETPSELVPKIKIWNLEILISLTNLLQVELGRGSIFSPPFGFKADPDDHAENPNLLAPFGMTLLSLVHSS